MWTKMASAHYSEQEVLSAQVVSAQTSLKGISIS